MRHVSLLYTALSLILFKLQNFAPSGTNIFYLESLFRKPKTQNILLCLKCYINIYQKREIEREREKKTKERSPILLCNNN